MSTPSPEPSAAPVIILVQPQLGENIGMAARAMRNFGLSELRLVSPRDGWIAGSAVMQAASDAAVGAADIVRSARLFDNVRSAIGDLTFVYATTARERGQGKPVVAPAQEMPLIAERLGQGQNIGVVFGPERAGLSNEDVSLADAVMSFPVDPAFASLNLAQAVLLVGYDWFRTTQSGLPPIGRAEAVLPAKRAAVTGFFDDLEALLVERGYFRPEEKQAVMMRNLRNILHRTGMSEQDVRTLRGVVRSLAGGRDASQSRSRAAGDDRPKG